MRKREKVREGKRQRGKGGGERPRQRAWESERQREGGRGTNSQTLFLGERARECDRDRERERCEKQPISTLRAHRAFIGNASHMLSSIVDKFGSCVDKYGSFVDKYGSFVCGAELYSAELYFEALKVCNSNDWEREGKTASGRGKRS